MTDLKSTVPGRIVVAGDWHGNRRWATRLIGYAANLLADEEEKLILHCGDFGIWPGAAGELYIDAVIGAAFEHDMRLWFVDGNHEDFTQLEAFRITASDDKVISWLPRGHRWTWHGRTWCAAGGAASVDRALRTEGLDWWPQERITTEQAAAITRGGRADVLVAHDCPSGVTHTFGPPPAAWAPADLARSDAHRERLQDITDVLQPSHIMHGHLHKAYSRTVDFGYGPVSVTGLNCDGQPGNYAVLDTRTMEWEVPQ